MAAISENTQADFDNAEAVVVDMLHAQRPDVPLGRGTVLRELLVRPAAEIYAADTRRVEESMKARSLKLMQESGEASVDDVNAILSNFSTSLYGGRNASGYLFIQVSEDSVYSIPANTIFQTLDGLTYKISQGYVVTSAAMDGDGYLKLQQNSNGVWYFVIPVEAEEIGSEYEVEAGVRFSIAPDFNGFVSAISYAKFSGGLDAQPVAEAIDALDKAVSLRGLGSRASIESTLLDKNAGNFVGSVLACSVVGYGDAEQIRDKTNVFGVATGGKVDLFVRTFTTPTVLTFEKTGKFVGETIHIDPHHSLTYLDYQIYLDHSEVPGYYAIKSITEVGNPSQSSAFGANDMQSADSFPVKEEQFDLVPAGVHTLPDSPQGAAYTAFRNVRVTVNRGTQLNNLVVDPTRSFLVSVYAYPVVSKVQEYVDRKDVRSLRDDILVRTAPICFVQVSASVSTFPGHPALDVYAMRKAVADYINSRSFVNRLTASEIVAVLSKFDISRVEMMFGVEHGFKMQGRIKKADGSILKLFGPDLDIDAYADPGNLVTPNTVCFATNIEDIEIKVMGDD